MDPTLECELFFEKVNITDWPFRGKIVNIQVYFQMPKPNANINAIKSINLQKAGGVGY